jgi:hypothetical protein
MVGRLRKRSLLFGVILPLALLAGQASTIVHSMVVEHERCREHGELVHRVLVPGESAAADGPATGADARRPRLGAATVEEHGHDHCLSMIDRRDGLRPPQRPALAMAATPRPPMVPAAALARPVRGALILLAPKTSPPRTAG